MAFWVAPGSMLQPATQLALPCASGCHRSAPVRRPRASIPVAASWQECGSCAGFAGQQLRPRIALADRQRRGHRLVTRMASKGGLSGWSVRAGCEQTVARRPSCSIRCLHAAACADARPPRSHRHHQAGPERGQGQPLAARWASPGCQGLAAGRLQPRWHALPAASASRARAGRQHHGLLQRLQRRHAGQNRHHHPCRDHRL